MILPYLILLIVTISRTGVSVFALEEAQHDGDDAETRPRLRSMLWTDQTESRPQTHGWAWNTFNGDGNETETYPPVDQPTPSRVEKKWAWKGKGKGKGGGKWAKGKGSSYKGKGYWAKGKGASFKGKGHYDYKGGKGTYHHGKGQWHMMKKKLELQSLWARSSDPDKQHWLGEPRSEEHAQVLENEEGGGYWEHAVAPEYGPPYPKGKGGGKWKGMWKGTWKGKGGTWKGKGGTWKGKGAWKGKGTWTGKGKTVEGTSMPTFPPSNFTSVPAPSPDSTSP